MAPARPDRPGCSGTFTWPARPVASTMARSVAALTLSWNDSNRSQVIAVSNVSLMMPRSMVRSRAKGMRIKALRQAPAAPYVLTGADVYRTV